MINSIDQMKHVLCRIKETCKNSTECGACLLDTICNRDGHACPGSWDEDDIGKLTIKETEAV